MATTRRELLVAGIGATTLLACRHGAAGSEHKPDHDDEEEEVTPAEDLMREHGVLRRILLVWAEAARRLQANESVPPDALASSAAIVRKFVEDYHERLEEQHLFPRFEAAKQHVELVAVLRAQHKVGRVLTDRILAAGNASALGDAAKRGEVVTAIADFRRMYEPHAAREDTVLFPALIKVVGHEEYEELGERFEEEEHKLFGARGFQGIVDEVAAIETTLGIADLASFTPKLS
jgi:hemerythrin-like domain-containing protein